jgi:acyl-CoA reductase-like NAD-dependent aldehyde dehydrogenase
MQTRRVRRPIPLLVTAFVALLSAAAALAFSSSGAHAHGEAAHAGHATMPLTAMKAPIVSSKALALHDGMRKLWEDHITWTRLAIISLEGDTADTDATVARLLQNQADIGNAVKPFYGEAAGNQLTQLLREHILIAADLIAAAKAGDSGQVAATQERWVANADEIAALLHSANPRYWPLEVMKDEMHMHLNLTTEEAVAHLQGNWEADVAAYDKVHEHILHMADLLSNGLIKQFPSRFH